MRGILWQHGGCFSKFSNICYGGTCKFASSSRLCEWMEPRISAVMIMSGFVL